MGEVVSVICHRGSVNAGHFVSYHKVGNHWFLNDDSKTCSRMSSPFDPNKAAVISSNETVDMIFIKS